MLRTWLPPKQAEVYANLDRVEFHTTKHQTTVYRLDGKDCRQQITSLIVKGLVSHGNGERPKRIGASPYV